MPPVRCMEPQRFYGQTIGLERKGSNTITLESGRYAILKMIRMTACLLVLLAFAAQSALSNPQFTYYATNTGGISKPDLEAHIGCANAEEVARWLGKKMVRVKGLVVVLPLVKNINHAEPLRVNSSTVRLKLASGDVLSALSPDEVVSWARSVGISQLREPGVLKGIEVSRGEALGFAAVFRLPAGKNPKKVEAEMTLELGSEGTVQVKSTLF